LNCTEENEFPEHIVELEDGQWEPKTKAGEYHLESIGLRESCHRQKRYARKRIAEQILNLCSTAIQYRTFNPAEVHNQMMDTLRALLSHLDNFPPLVVEDGVLSPREWLNARGVDVSVLQVAPA
jgi:hypothetical protein